MSSSSERNESRDGDSQLWTAMLSNFSTSYNAVNIGLVFPMLKLLKGDESREAESIIASALLVGMMAGQLFGGVAGDFIGILPALRLCMIVQVLSSLLSCVSSATFWLVTFRFILGIGAGGIYPLAALLSKGNSSEDSNKSVSRVVWTFSMQGIGFGVAPLLGLILLHLVSHVQQLEWVWRIMLGIGSVPGIVLLAAQSKPDRMAVAQDERGSDPMTVGESTESVQEEAMHDGGGTVVVESSDSPADIQGRWFHIFLSEPNIFSKLIGTAATWFLFDILFYGNTIFQPIVIEAAFGRSDAASIAELRELATTSLLVSTISLPGYFMAGLLIGKRVLCVEQTPRYVMMQGFAIMAILYYAMGMAWKQLQHSNPSVLILLYSLTFLFANYGPNTTTFALPSMVYSQRCRSTLNGISAAAGKVGAALGASIFAPLASRYGDETVLLVCGSVAALSFALTGFFVPSSFSPVDDEETAEEEEGLAPTATGILS